MFKKIIGYVVARVYLYWCPFCFLRFWKLGKFNDHYLVCRNEHMSKIMEEVERRRNRVIRWKKARLAVKEARKRGRQARKRGRR